MDTHSIDHPSFIWSYDLAKFEHWASYKEVMLVRLLDLPELPAISRNMKASL